MTNEKLNLVFVFQQNFQPYRPSKVKVNKTLKKILFSISPKKQGQSGRIKKKISIFFGGIEDKKVMFWDFLTITLAVEDKKIYEDVMHG